MRFNKYLAMCFLTSTLMCGSFTSCDDDDDNNNNGNNSEVKSSAEQGRTDGKKFGEDYKVVTGDGEAIDKTASAISLISSADKYKKSTDNAYKTAFAESAAEVVTGTEAKGDAAVEKLNSLLDGLSDVEALKGQLTSGTQEEKANAIVKIMNLFSKKNNSQTSSEA